MDKNIAALVNPETSEVAGIDKVLEERGSRYGEFKTHASITQALKRTMHESSNWIRLSEDKKEALEMVMHKVGRILNGDPEYLDSWTDIIGYTRLVELELMKNKEGEQGNG